MISRAMSKAVKQAGKQQQANTRGLSGNRNSQGDFMPEDVQMKGVQDSVTPDIQNYIDDVKSQIDEIDAQIEIDTKDKDYDSMMNGIKQKRDILFALRTKLEENDIEMPVELDEMLTDAAVDAYDPADLADEYYGGAESRRLDKEASAYEEAGRRKFSER